MSLRLIKTNLLFFSQCVFPYQIRGVKLISILCVPGPDLAFVNLRTLRSRRARAGLVPWWLPEQLGYFNRMPIIVKENEIRGFFSH